MSQMTYDIDVTTHTKKKPLERDCIVFLPGIGGGAVIDQTVEGLAHRFAFALDLNARDNTAVFHSKVRAVEDLSACKGEVGTVYRKDDQGDSPVIDIYKLDYRDTLVERYENRNLLIKALLLLLVLPGSLSRILGAMLTGRSSKTRAEKIQLLYALGFLCLLIVYVVILFGAMCATIKDSGRVSCDLASVAQVVRDSAQTAWRSLSGQKEGPQTGADDKRAQSAAVAQPETRTSIWLRLSQAVVVLWAAIGLFLPPKFSFKDTISKASVDYLCLIYYLKLGEQRNTIVGRLEELIDEISRRSENERRNGSGKHYRHIHLFAYSFGSIVALDALFPAGRKPGRPLQTIHTLVTVGCPFDFVRTFWSYYFDKRRGYEKNQPVRWLNVYSPVDVLASNFRNNPQIGEANINVRSQQTASDPEVPAPVNVPFTEGLDFSQLSWSSSFTLIGLRAHTIYWGIKREAEVNCFSELVLKMYDGDDVLG